MWVNDDYFIRTGSQTDPAIGADLEKEFMELPANTGYYAYQYARACDTLRHKEAVYDMVHADLYNEARKELGNFKEAERKAWVQSQDEYHTAVQEVNEAKYTKDIIKATLDAITAKKEIFTTIRPHAKGRPIKPSWVITTIRTKVVRSDRSIWWTYHGGKTMNDVLKQLQQLKDEQEARRKGIFYSMKSGDNWLYVVLVRTTPRRVSYEACVKICRHHTNGEVLWMRSRTPSQETRRQRNGWIPSRQRNAASCGRSLRTSCERRKRRWRVDPWRCKTRGRIRGCPQEKIINTIPSKGRNPFEPDDVQCLNIQRTDRDDAFKYDDYAVVLAKNMMLPICYRRVSW